MVVIIYTQNWKIDSRDGTWVIENLTKEKKSIISIYGKHRDSWPTKEWLVVLVAMSVVILKYLILSSFKVCFSCK